MKEQLKQRLQMLKTEYEAGQKMLAELEAKQANLRETLLRISGAIQVLEEVLNEVPEENEPEENGSVSEISNPGGGAIAPPNPSEPLVL